MENALPGVKCVSRLDLSGKKFLFYFMNITFLNSRDQIDHVERTQLAITVPDRDQVATLIVTRYGTYRYLPGTVCYK
jgi:hypothetical protein